MPYKIIPLGNGQYDVVSPHGKKAKGTTKKKAESQVRFLQGLKHGTVKPIRSRRANKKLSSKKK